MPDLPAAAPTLNPPVRSQRVSPALAWTHDYLRSVPSSHWWRIGVGATLLLLAFAWLSWQLPLSRAMDPLPEPTLILLDRTGESFARRGAYKEAPVDASALPAHVRDAVLSIEDRRFYAHGGIDLRGVVRAARHNTQAGRIEQGGSTITQQLAKTSFLPSDRTFRRKAQEALIALWLELRLDKNEILSRYLSSIYFGDGVYGLRGAARHYFDRAPEDLDLGEAAMLAGMIKAPSTLAPTDNLEGARKRAKVVLQAMVAAGTISAQQADQARPARLRNGRESLPVGSYFADWVSPQAKRAFDSGYGEVPVPTTLDPRLQALGERVVRAAVGRGARDGVGQGALVAMHANGEVLAMVGGRDYASSAFNRVTQAQRQPGSVFKLFVYLAALRDGMTADSLVDDAPISIGDWSPRNFNEQYAGPITLREAFARSSNVAAVRLAEQVGPRAVVRAAKDLGIRSELVNEPTLALGVSETNLLEMTAAYATLLSGVSPVVPLGLLGMAGRTDAKPPEPLDPGHRAALLDMLASAVETGTGRAARLSAPAFGKTGTTQDHRDALFIGISGDLVVGVWVGNDDNTAMQGVTGGGVPARMWSEFTAQATGTRALGARAVPAATPRATSRSKFQRLRQNLRQWSGGQRGKGKGRKDKKR